MGAGEFSFSRPNYARSCALQRRRLLKTWTKGRSYFQPTPFYFFYFRLDLILRLAETGVATLEIYSSRYYSFRPQTAVPVRMSSSGIKSIASGNAHPYSKLRPPCRSFSLYRMYIISEDIYIVIIIIAIIIMDSIDNNHMFIYKGPMLYKLLW